MFSGGIPRAFARTLFPSTDGKPRKSAETIATRVSPPCKTKARTVRSPSFLETGWDGPTPPDTGNKGSGVTTRTAMPARNSAAARLASRVRLKRNQYTKAAPMIFREGIQRRARQAKRGLLGLWWLSKMEIFILHGFDCYGTKAWP